MKILVVDDAMVMRNIHKNALVEAKIKEQDIFEAGDGAVALEMAEKDFYDLILVDWNMPGLNGLEFVKRLRTMESYSASPIIMVTSEAAKYNIMEAIDAGITSYIVKTIKSNVLIDKISKYLSA
jgi:two-component system chemotaxis response regulator CheY